MRGNNGHREEKCCGESVYEPLPGADETRAVVPAKIEVESEAWGDSLGDCISNVMLGVAELDRELLSKTVIIGVAGGARVISLILTHVAFFRARALHQIMPIAS